VVIGAVIQLVTVCQLCVVVRLVSVTEQMTAQVVAPDEGTVAVAALVRATKIVAHADMSQQGARGVEFSSTERATLLLVRAADHERLQVRLLFVVIGNDDDQFRFCLALLRRHLTVIADDKHVLRLTGDCVMHNTSDRLSL